MKIIDTIMGGFAALLFVTFWSAITLMFDFQIASGIVAQIQSRFYPQTTGTMLESRVYTEQDSDGGTSYKSQLEYTYTVRQRTYTGKRFSHTPMGSAVDARPFVSEHPTGSTATVYYNPNNPEDAVLSTGIGPMTLMMLMFMTPFNLIMFCGWYVLLKFPALKIFGLKKSLQTIADGPTRRARLLEFTPFDAALVALGAATFIGTFIGMFGLFFASAGLWAIVSLWAVVFAICAYVYLRRKTTIESGALDVVIDDATVTLPPRCDRQHTQSLSRKDLCTVAIETIHKSDGEGTTTTYAPVLGYTDSSGNAATLRVDEFSDQKNAEEMAAWLSAELNIKAAEAGVL